MSRHLRQLAPAIAGTLMLACASTHPVDDRDAGDDIRDIGPDGWLDPTQVGQVAVSCGAESQGLTPIDCTAHGDASAYCVFGNHCACTTGFVCDGATTTGVECAPGVSCVPTP